MQGRPLIIAIAVCGVVSGAVIVTAVLGTSAATPIFSGIANRGLDDRIQLVDVRQDTSRLAAERVVTTDLTWLVRRPSQSGFPIRVTVTAADGTAHESAWPYETLSRHWQRGELVRTTVVTRLPPDYPPGPARVRLSMGEGTSTSGVDVAQIAVPTPSVRVDPPLRGARAEIVGGISLGPGTVSTSGWRPNAVPRPGDHIGVDLEWQATTTAPDRRQEYLTVLALEGPGGELVSEPSRPGDWLAPLPFWQAGDLVVQRAYLTLPSTLRAGSYPLSARIYARELARGGLAAPGGSPTRARGRPIAQIPLGDLEVAP